MKNEMNVCKLWNHTYDVSELHISFWNKYFLSERSYLLAVLNVELYSEHLYIHNLSSGPFKLGKYASIEFTTVWLCRVQVHSSFVHL